MSLSIADRRRRREVLLPVKFVDFVPQPLADEADSIPSSPSSIVPSPPASPAASLVPAPASEPSFIDTAQNLYGLYRRFRGKNLPAHDPESAIGLSALNDAALAPSGAASLPGSENTSDLDPLQSLYPFNNKNAFLIGEWQYSDDTSTSQKRFHRLLDIIGDPNFKPEDIRNTNWNKIHKILGSNVFDSEEQAEWEDVDAGWEKKPVSISVPFHGSTPNPGVRDFAVGDLYHRKLTKIIEEKLANPTDDVLFHYEPYELRWQPRADGTASTRVHGEFYASPAFRSAHEELQAVPNEPGCSLDKVVLAMEFASDATHLTTSGNNQLHPIYLYFLNESKYRRCKPTSNLCNHVAYFQSVSYGSMKAFLHC